MLMHTTGKAVNQIFGVAHIVISLDQIGETTVRAFCFDRVDCSLNHAPDKVLLERDLPFLLAELRLQLELGRPLTVAESAPLKAARRQRLSGSIVTE